MNPKELATLKKIVYAEIEDILKTSGEAIDPFMVISDLNHLSEIYYKLANETTIAKNAKDKDTG